MSRQVDWQRRQVREGRCHKCGKKRDCASISSCFSCLKKARAAHRPKTAWRPGQAGRVPLEKIRQHEKYCQKQRKKVCKLADVGHTREQIAVILQCSVSHIESLFKGAVKKHRKWAWWRLKHRQKDVRRLIVMYEAGASLAVLREVFNTTSFYRIFKEWGVTIRKRGRPRKP